MSYHNRYISPYSDRYGTGQGIWGELNKRRLWREAWITLMMEQARADILKLSTSQMSVLTHLTPAYTEKDYQAALEREKITRHDVVAELELFSESLPPFLQSVIHLGATSSDIEDYAERVQMSTHLALISQQLRTLLNSLASWALEYTPTIGRTHLQPAEPTTIGYRFALYGQELMSACEHYRLASSEYNQPRGFRGAVGTGSNQVLVFQEYATVSAAIPGDSDMVVGQVYPRQQDLRLLQSFDAIGSILGKMAIDIRFLQSTGVLTEKKHFGQVGSSAMPTKSNPIRSERISGLVQSLHAQVGVCWQMATMNILERTLDEKIARRTYLPEAFIGLSEILESSTAVLSGLHVDAVVCLNELRDNWKTWLPSRVLAMRQVNEVLMNRKDLYAFTEQSTIKYHDGESWLNAVYADLGTNPPMVEDLLCLNRAVQIALNVSNDIVKWVKSW